MSTAFERTQGALLGAITAAVVLLGCDTPHLEPDQDSTWRRATKVEGARPHRERSLDPVAPRSTDKRYIDTAKVLLKLPEHARAAKVHTEEPFKEDDLVAYLERDGRSSYAIAELRASIDPQCVPQREEDQCWPPEVWVSYAARAVMKTETLDALSDQDILDACGLDYTSATVPELQPPGDSKAEPAVIRPFRNAGESVLLKGEMSFSRQDDGTWDWGGIRGSGEERSWETDQPVPSSFLRTSVGEGTHLQTGSRGFDMLCAQMKQDGKTDEPGTFSWDPVRDARPSEPVADPPPIEREFQPEGLSLPKVEHPLPNVPDGLEVVITPKAIIVGGKEVSMLDASGRIAGIESRALVPALRDALVALRVERFMAATPPDARLLLSADARTPFETLSAVLRTWYELSDRRDAALVLRDDDGLGAMVLSTGRSEYVGEIPMAIYIDERGFVVGDPGGALILNTMHDTSRRTKHQRLALDATGTHPYAALRSAAKQHKQVFAGQPASMDHARAAFAPEVPYAILVGTLDTLRGETCGLTGGKCFFRDPRIRAASPDAAEVAKAL